MVSTRSSSSRADSAAPEPPSPATPPPSARPSKRTPRPPASTSTSASAAPSRRAAASRPPSGWSHTPPPLVLAWMAISLPLVVWDTGYVLGRPHTMDGGALHWPLWAPYKLYADVDYIYGWRALQARNGFTAAQSLMNLVETAMYLLYLSAWWAARPDGGRLRGRPAARAALVGFSAAVMSLSKTALYWLNEYYSSFDNIGHNNLARLVTLWIIPNGAWLVGSTYMICTIGADIVDGLAAASAPQVKHA